MPDQKKIIITRMFDAPIDLVWKYWTVPEYFMKWWGPKDFTCPISKIDLRKGGKYLHCMQGPDKKKYWSTGTYRKIAPTKRIVATDSFADEKGNVVSAAYYGMEDLPMELLITVTFEKTNGKTKVTLQHEEIPEGEMRKLTTAGWEESFDKMAKEIKKDKN